MYMYIVIVIVNVIVILCWWIPFITSRNLDKVFTYNIMLL